MSSANPFALLASSSGSGSDSDSASDSASSSSEVSRLSRRLEKKNAKIAAAKAAEEAQLVAQANADALGKTIDQRGIEEEYATVADVVSCFSTLLYLYGKRDKPDENGGYFLNHQNGGRFAAMIFAPWNAIPGCPTFRKFKSSIVANECVQEFHAHRKIQGDLNKVVSVRTCMPGRGRGYRVNVTFQHNGNEVCLPAYLWHQRAKNGKPERLVVAVEINFRFNRKLRFCGWVEADPLANVTEALEEMGDVRSSSPVHQDEPRAVTTSTRSRFEYDEAAFPALVNENPANWYE